MPKELTVGLIGAGRIGADHARTISTLDGIKQIVVADVETERAQKVADELGAKLSTPDTILGEVDAVVIATPTSAHADHLIAAAEAGVPIFCEKPVALDVATTKQVIETVARTGTLAQIGFMRRFDAGYINAKKLLEEGAIGELRRAHVITGDFPPPPASYIPGSGGIFKDCTIHDADILRWVTGREVEEVFVLGENRGEPYFGQYGDIDEGAGVMRLDDGTLVTMQVTRNNGAGYDIRMELAGTKETLSVGFAEFMAVTSAEPDFTFEQAGERFPNFYPRFVPAYKAEIAAFIDTLNTGGESLATVEDALEALYICEALDLSRKEHRPVKLAEVRQG
jgi:myo-inositol 2-dehydrogenase/D-chiro-inositol 1-dehydrogenase